MSRSNLPRPPSDDHAALVHSLEVHQAELEVMNEELAIANEELRVGNAAIALARDRYATLHQLAPVPLITVDARGTMLEVNAGAEAMLDTRRDSLIDRRFALFVPEAARASFAATLRALFTTGAIHDVELRVVPTDRAPLDVVVDGAVIPQAPDDPARAMLALVDVTARRRASDAHRLDSLHVFAGGIAHSLNNLMSVVLFATDHAADVLGDESPVHDDLRGASDAARRAAVLAHQMLAYTGGGAPTARAIDPAAMLRALEPRLRALASDNELVVQLDEPLPVLMGDEAQLQQVVLDVVLNAAEALAGRRGLITVTARGTGSRLELEVRDDGIGMTDETLARILEPYFSTKFAGRGLGLAVVDGAVRRHAGTIRVESTPHGGTTVTMSFPAAPATTPSPPAVVARAPARAGRTVLVVDDEPAVARAMARLLGSWGLSVLIARGGAEAVALFADAEHEVDLVLMDLTMPRMDGVTAARAIRALRPDLPIVLVTGYGTIPEGARALFAEVLAKPIGFGALRALLDDLIPTAAPA